MGHRYDRLRRPCCHAVRSWCQGRARRLSVYFLLLTSSPTPAGIADRGCDTQALLGLLPLATAAASFYLISLRHIFFHSSSTPIFVTGDHTSSGLARLHL